MIKIKISVIAILMWLAISLQPYSFFCPVDIDLVFQKVGPIRIGEGIQLATLILMALIAFIKTDKNLVSPIIVHIIFWVIASASWGFYITMLLAPLTAAIMALASVDWGKSEFQR